MSDRSASGLFRVCPRRRSRGGVIEAAGQRAKLLGADGRVGFDGQVGDGLPHVAVAARASLHPAPVRYVRPATALTHVLGHPQAQLNSLQCSSVKCSIHYTRHDTLVPMALPERCPHCCSRQIQPMLAAMLRPREWPNVVSVPRLSPHVGRRPTTAPSEIRHRQLARVELSRICSIPNTVRMAACPPAATPAAISGASARTRRRDALTRRHRQPRPLSWRARGFGADCGKLIGSLTQTRHSRSLHSRVYGGARFALVGSSGSGAAIGRSVDSSITRIMRQPWQANRLRTGSALAVGAAPCPLL